MDDKEPYRATRLWNEVIVAFQSGMPLKKHRRRMHTYNDCFIASDGVAWLHCYLMNSPNFGPDVTRQQTVHLLQKFLKCHVMESATFKSKKIEFLDNSHLYRFISVSPQNSKTLPLRLLQSPAVNKNEKNKKVEHCKRIYSVPKAIPEIQKENLPECHIIEKKLSLAEMGLMWKSATLARLEKLLTDISLNDILDDKVIDGHVIKHNVCRLSKTGVVCLIDKTDDIPHWVISAMKCLTNWPNASGSGSCLPNYPGFEKDVFKVVKDFFINPQIPLIPKQLSSALLKVYRYFFREYDWYSFKDSSGGHDRSCKSSATSSSAVKTSTPLADHETVGVISSSNNITLSENNEGRLLLDDPEIMWDYPSAFYFETDFGTTDPVTRMIPDQTISRTMSNSYAHSLGSIDSISTISICSVNQQPENTCNNLLIHKTPLKAWNSDSLLQEDIKTPIISFKHYSASPRAKTIVMRKAYTECDYTDASNTGDNEINILNHSITSTKTITECEEKLSLSSEKHNDVKNSVHIGRSFDNLNSSTIASVNKITSFLNHGASSQKISEINTSKGEGRAHLEELRSSFQLMLLFLPPPNRRQLHLLLRVINKILKNRKFVLDLKMPMRDYLLQTFYPAIVQSELSENVLLAMTSFLLDNCEALFQPPNSLKEEVANLSLSHKGKIIYSVDDTCFLTYCELVSKQQYEEQKVSVSVEALRSLLHNITQDQTITEKERKRRLKQFKENHPDVYYLQFPDKLGAKSKKSLLNKLTNLRM